MSLEECRIIEIPSFSDSRGDLCVLEKGDVLPFEIKRIFYTYNVPPSESRGAHAHKKCHQFLIAVSGAVRVIAEDGRSRKEFCLDEPTRGVLLPAGVWGIQYGIPRERYCSCWRRNVMTPRIISGGMKIIWSM